MHTRTEPLPSSSLRTVLGAAGLTTRAQLARGLGMGGAAVIPLLLFLPYVSSAGVGGTSASGWNTLGGSEVLLVVLSVGIVGLMLTDLFVSPSRQRLTV